MAEPTITCSHLELSTQVSIREMKNRLSKYLKLVQTDTDAVITDRGRPAAG